MSVFSEIVNGLKDKLTGENETESVIYPCSNCESDCGAYPSACAECKPYKEKLIDALYNVEHSEDYYARYEIVPEGTAASGVTVCPYCNAPASGTVCEYCGSRIAEGNGKIQVKSASEIPNPVIEARNLIYARRKVIAKYTGGTASSDGDDSEGLFGTIVSALTGKNGTQDTLGSAMTEAEIEKMAETYGVSVHDYLEGLDMGTYLSKTGYEKKQTTVGYSGTGAATVAGATGAAGLGSAIAGLFGKDSGDDRPQYRPEHTNRPEPPSFDSDSRDGRERPRFDRERDPRSSGNRQERPGGHGNGESHGYGSGRGNGELRGSGRDSGHGGPGDSHGSGGPGGRNGRGGR